MEVIVRLRKFVSQPWTARHPREWTARAGESARLAAGRAEIPLANEPARWRMGRYVSHRIPLAIKCPFFVVVVFLFGHPPDISGVCIGASGTVSFVAIFFVARAQLVFAFVGAFVIIAAFRTDLPTNTHRQTRAPVKAGRA